MAEQQQRVIISSFRGKHFFLSNFYVPATVKHNGIKFPSVEHAYQAAKTENEEQQKNISRLNSPSLAKQTGRRYTVRDDWESVRENIMRDLLMQKFSDPVLRARLIGTGDAELIEGNTWGDEFWGAMWDRQAKTWKGENRLGRLLMEVREALKHNQ